MFEFAHGHKYQEGREREREREKWEGVGSALWQIGREQKGKIIGQVIAIERLQIYEIISILTSIGVTSSRCHISSSSRDEEYRASHQGRIQSILFSD